MAINFQSYATLSAEARAELRRQQPDIDPTIFGSFARPFVDGAAALAYSEQLLIMDLLRELFPQTSEGEFLDRWGDYEGLPRLAASPATGTISIGGTAGTLVPAATVFNSGNGLSYASDIATTIQVVSQSISTVTRSGTTVTVTTAANHTLATGLTVTISGADQTEYNGSFSITVTARNQFTYTIATSPTTPATGTIALSSTYASVRVTSTTAGVLTNLSSGAILTLDSAVTGVNSSGFAQFDGLSGGSAVETDDAYLIRVLLSRSLIEGVYTSSQIRLAALGIAGNTRVFVVTPTLSVADPAPAPGFVPAPGQTAVYVLRDNDANIIPTATVLAATKAAIIANGKLPANSSTADLFVFAPTTVAVDFTFTSLSPDTPTMRTAVTNQLIALFQDGVTFDQDVLEASYLGKIQNTQDLATGQFITSFALSAPSGNVSISDGEIAILGTVTFP
jgi:uncharacterized phage protein gp47/JayE